MLDRVDDLMPIGEFAAASGLSPKMLRSYAAAGLLVPAAVDRVTGYRFYSPGQIARAQAIGTLRTAGISIGDISTFLIRPTAATIERWERALESEVDRRRAALLEIRDLVLIADEDDPKHMTTDAHIYLGGTVPMLRMAGATETGPVRDNNEDAWVLDTAAAAVADGMGGHAAGEVASQLAIDAFQAASPAGSVENLRRAVSSANSAVWERSRDEALTGMGTTLCALVAIRSADEPTLAVANVGDSRAYLMRDGELSLLTDDHTVVAELVRRGDLAPEDAAAHPHRNVLTRVLGVGPDVDPDVVTVQARAGDRLLLCTDGLVNEIGDDGLAEALREAPDPDRAAERLVAAAVSASGKDNVTVVVVDVLPS